MIKQWMRYITLGLIACISLLLNGCVHYSDALLIGSIQYSNKIMPRLNQTDINNYPVNCVRKGVGIKDWKVVARKNPLATKTQLLLLTNVRKQPIYIDMYKKDPGASAGWLTRLDPQNWSALTTGMKHFAFVCLQQNGNKGLRKVDCGHYINGCWMTVNRKPHPNDGSYWVVDNKLLQAAYLIMNQRGFKLMPVGDL